MPDPHDQEFALRLLELAKADFEKVFQQPVNPTRRAIALWMCDEMLKEAASLKISDNLAGDLREKAREIRSAVLSTRPAREIPTADIR